MAIQNTHFSEIDILKAVKGEESILKMQEKVREYKKKWPHMKMDRLMKKVATEFHIKLTNDASVAAPVTARNQK